jgi:hypothetical protein
VADQIFTDGPIDAPAKYVVPGSSAIVPIAVQAVLDGTNASGDFVPALIFRSQAGHVIARVPTSTTVPAGGSAEVSWFPHGMSGGGGGAAGFTPAWAVGTKTGLGVIGPGTVAVTWADFETTDSSVFSLNSGDNTKIMMASPGIVLLSGDMQTTTQPTSFTTTATMFASVTDAHGIDVGTYFGAFWYFADATVADPKEVTLMQGDDYANCAATFTFPISIRAFFQLGQAVGIGGAHLTVTRLTPVGV